MSDCKLIQETLRYDPDTGNLIWKLDRGRRVKAGSIAGAAHCAGYVQLRLQGKNYLAHRIAFLLMTGKWPEHQVDHINGVKDDNRWSNLRDVTNTVNSQNQRKPRPGNKTGLLGVSSKPKGKFQAQIKIDGKIKYLGLFDSADKAHDAYLLAKRELHEGNTL